MSIEELRAERIRKLELLKEKGVEPYPAASGRLVSIKEVQENFDALLAEEETLAIAGRIMAIREHGGSAFLDVYDGTGRMQVFLKKDEVGDELFDLFEKTVDIGDFIDVAGKPMVTKRGEQSVLAREWEMLSKSLRPLPEKWHGLQDPEAKLRHRYLDILLNEDTREMVEARARFWKATRTFLEDKGFLEVETPAFETTSGGADARPFVTHHNALNMDVYLRIAAGELWQKRLMVAGIPKTFEIGRIFRNEGMSAEHLQDYTQMEFYWGYANYQQGMALVEELYKHIAQETFGTLEFTIGEHTVDLGAKWEVYDYRETILDKTSIDINDTTLEAIEDKLKELNVKYDTEGWNMTRAVDTLWKYCRKQISGPGFLVHVPVFMEPLAKRHQENPDVVERFQVLIAGSENGKGYSELNDPIDQKARFDEQQKLRDKGDDEAHMADYDFVEALEYGMPPTCGFGFSERLFAFLANKPVREAQIFPLMKPKNND